METENVQTGINELTFHGCEVSLACYCLDCSDLEMEDFKERDEAND